MAANTLIRDMCREIDDLLRANTVLRMENDSLRERQRELWRERVLRLFTSEDPDTVKQQELVAVTESLLTDLLTDNCRLEGVNQNLIARLRNSSMTDAALSAEADRQVSALNAQLSFIPSLTPLCMPGCPCNENRHHQQEQEKNKPPAESLQ